MCDFLRVIAWFCDEKFSLKKSCFYLYIRRKYELCWNATRGGKICKKIWITECIVNMHISQIRKEMNPPQI